MTPADFTAFVAYARTRFKWSRARLARELGCGPNQVKRWCDAGAPPYIALACSALAYGLPGWPGQPAG